MPSPPSRERQLLDDRLWPLFLEAVLKGRRRSALDVTVEALEQGFSQEEVYLRLFQRSLYEIGRMWEEGEISVAGEHVGTAVVQYVVAEVYCRLEIREPTRGRMVLAGVEGELHQLGPNLVADRLEADGWDVLFLGTDVPGESVLAMLEERPADVFGLSVTMGSCLPRAVRLIEDLGRRFGARAPAVLVGGRAFRDAGELAAQLGAVGVGHDLRDAVALARTITPTPPG